MSQPSQDRLRPQSVDQPAAHQARSSSSARSRWPPTGAAPHRGKKPRQRVTGYPCASCGGRVLRAGRGPAPRLCVACEVQSRDLRQLPAYLRSAERLAAALDRCDVANAARGAVAALDAGRVP